MNAQTITADQALSRLISEGYARNAVTATVDSFIGVGAQYDEDEGVHVFTPEDVEVLREQLGTPLTAERAALAATGLTEWINSNAEGAADLYNLTEIVAGYAENLAKDGKVSSAAGAAFAASIRAGATILGTEDDLEDQQGLAQHVMNAFESA